MIKTIYVSRFANSSEYNCLLLEKIFLILLNEVLTFTLNKCNVLNLQYHKIWSHSTVSSSTNGSFFENDNLFKFLYLFSSLIYMMKKGDKSCDIYYKNLFSTKRKHCYWIFRFNIISFLFNFIIICVIFDSIFFSLC